MLAAYFNAGQDCTAATRVIVHESVHDEFVAALADASAANARTGGPREEGVLYGPLNNANQLAHVSGFIDRLPAHADVAAGGRRQGDRGLLLGGDRRSPGSARRTRPCSARSSVPC